LLYNAHVDCYLPRVCEIIPDAVDVNIEPLVDIQKHFLRRILHLGKRLMSIPLHSETGIIPLRSHRF
ncbi:hypothetical protein DFS33DRAFT_1235496, partial [Desarmillaria ectypa]